MCVCVCVCVSGVSVAECAVVVSCRSCGCLVICVCVFLVHSTCYSLFSVDCSHKQSCMTGNVLTVNTKATLTISTLTIIPGCCMFLLLIFSSVCSWHWFALSSSLFSFLSLFLSQHLSSSCERPWQTHTPLIRKMHSHLSGFFSVITSRNVFCAKYQEVRGQGTACGSGQGGLHISADDLAHPDKRL